MKAIKFEMDQNMAALVVGAFANMIGAIIDAHQSEDIETHGGMPCLIMPYGGNVPVAHVHQVVVHKIQIMANLATAFKVPQWTDLAWMSQEAAIRAGVIPDLPDSHPLKSAVRGRGGDHG